MDGTYAHRVAWGIAANELGRLKPQDTPLGVLREIQNLNSIAMGQPHCSAANQPMGVIMGADMREDHFGETAFGKLALEQLGSVPENFRLYEAGMLPEPPMEWTHMRVSGAEFRESLSGPDKGKLNIMVTGTRRTVNVPRSEIEQFKKAIQPATS